MLYLSVMENIIKREGGKSAFLGKFGLIRSVKYFTGSLTLQAQQAVQNAVPVCESTVYSFSGTRDEELGKAFLSAVKFILTSAETTSRKVGKIYFCAEVSILFYVKWRWFLV